jgi:predicted DNA-binding transcriptional regulator AlpA
MKQEPDRVITLAEVAKRTTLSTDTLKREYADYIVRLSSRRLGITEQNVQRLIAMGLDMKRKNDP